MSKNKKTLIVTQIASPIGRQSYQKCLIGLGLNKLNRTKVLDYNESIFGMVKKVEHLVKYEIK